MNQRIHLLKHKFVEFVPDELEDNILYVSLEYATVVHKCCCGCGSKIVTPISQTDWVLIYNGRGISLHPSIGNWNIPCKSHYWIRDNKVVWASDQWTRKQVKQDRVNNILAKRHYYSEISSNNDSAEDSPKTRENLFIRLFRKAYQLFCKYNK